MLLKLLLVSGISFLIVSPNFVTGTKIISSKASTSTMACNKLKFTQDMGCVCVTGLWRFYHDCTSYYNIVGNSHCFRPDGHVNYAMEILSNPRSIVLIRGKNNQVEHLPLDTNKMENEVHHFLQPEDQVVTGSPHSLRGPTNSVCLFPQPGAFCTYQPQDFIGGEVTGVSPGCPENFPYLSPVRCDYTRGPQTCDDAEEAIENESLIDFLSETDNTANQQGQDQGNDLNSNEKFRRKRSPPSPSSSSSSSSHFGRTFLGAPGQTLDRAIGLPEDDEDYVSPAVVESMAAETNDAILSEIWTYIETSAQVEMGLRPRLSEEINYGIPLFKLLHLAKKIIQKVCPESYVPSKFFDIAVQTFVQTQVKRFHYDPRNNANFAAFTRIQEALEKCAAASTKFPFLPLSPEEAKIYNDKSLTSDCRGNNGKGKGQYFMYNQTLEMNVSESYMGLKQDPIVETVWKVFTTAQSYCFPFFRLSGFNDHHRFTAWLTPLFQNEIHDIWTKGSSSKLTYGQFLGNLEVVMEKVVYCAASARFLHNVTYPFELPRPSKTVRKRRGATLPSPDLDSDSVPLKNSFKNPECVSPEDAEALACFHKANHLVNLVSTTHWTL